MQYEITTLEEDLGGARDRIEALEDELTAAQKDAERYRWLRAKARTDTGQPWIARSFLSGISAWTMEHADAAIDAAIAAEKSNPPA